jgi:hypothetical protein
MLHNFEFRKEMRGLLEKRGYVLPIDPKLDFNLDVQTLPI